MVVSLCSSLLLVAFVDPFPFCRDDPYLLFRKEACFVPVHWEAFASDYLIESGHISAGTICVQKQVRGEPLYLMGEMYTNELPLPPSRTAVERLNCFFLEGRNGQHRCFSEAQEANYFLFNVLCTNKLHKTLLKAKAKGRVLAIYHSNEFAI